MEATSASIKSLQAIYNVVLKYVAFFVDRMIGIPFICGPKVVDGYDCWCNCYNEPSLWFVHPVLVVHHASMLCSKQRYLNKSRR